MLFWIIVVTGPVFSGDYAAAFLDIGVGARALAMGGAFCSIADDGTAFYWNPAGMSAVRQRTLSGMYGQQFGSLQKPFGHFHHVGLVQPLTGNASIGLNWMRLSIDEIPEYPELRGDSYLDRLYQHALRPTGEPTGYFSDVEDVFVFSFSKMLKQQFNMGWNYQDVRIDIPIGVNFKWIRQALYTYSATGMGLDLGAMIRIYFSDLMVNDEFGIFSFGMNFQDFTTTHIKWNTRHDDSVPYNIKWGVSYAQPLPFANHSILIAYDRDSRWQGDRHLGFSYTAFRHLDLRVGKHGKHLTGGAGLQIWRFGIDYAFITHELSDMHRISSYIKL